MRARSPFLPTSRLIEPALTTAHDPAEDLDAKSPVHLLAILRGEAGPAELELPSQFAPRESTAARRDRPEQISCDSRVT